MWAKQRIKIDPADRLFSIYIRLRDRMCQRCYKPVEFSSKGLPVTCQNSHFQGRGKENTRFDLDNCCTLCGGCHRYFTSHPGEHYEFQVKRLGQEKVDELILKSNMYHKKDRIAERLYWEQRLLKDFNIKV